MLLFDEIFDLMYVGELANELGRCVLTIKHYEAIGLIPEPKRDSKGWRIYTEGDIAKIEYLLKKAGKI